MAGEDIADTRIVVIIVGYLGRRGDDFIGSCGGIIGITVWLVYDFIGGPPIVTDTGGYCITIPARSFYQIVAEPPFGFQYRCLVQGLP